MSIIRNIIITSINQTNGESPSYSSLEPVIEALEDRETEIVSYLRGYALSKGLSETEINGLLIDVGLLSDSEPVTDQGLEAQVTKIGEQVAALIAAANRHGIHI